MPQGISDSPQRAWHLPTNHLKPVQTKASGSSAGRSPARRAAAEWRTIAPALRDLLVSPSHHSSRLVPAPSFGNRPAISRQGPPKQTRRIEDTTSSAAGLNIFKDIC